MKEYILNNAPIRTSNNYGINNIKLNLNIPEIKKYKNVNIVSQETDKFEISDLLTIPIGTIMPNKIGLELEKNYGMTITVYKNEIINKPIIINCDFDEENDELIDNIKIVFEENSKATFILKYTSKMTDNKCFHYLKQETVSKKNSDGEIIIANMLNDLSDSFISVENELKEHSKLSHILVELGGKNKISNYYSKLEGDYSENNIKNIYLGTNNDTLDINYNIETYGKNTKCNIESQGAISGNAIKNFKGTIDFKQGSKKSKGIENENCMILSQSAKSKSLPILLCHEEDVEGTHGVSTGKIDESKLFYIMTKGISYEEAKKLIVKANFNNIIKTINDEILQKEIDAMIEKKLA